MKNFLGARLLGPDSLSQDDPADPFATHND